MVRPSSVAVQRKKSIASKSADTAKKIYAGEIIALKSTLRGARRTHCVLSLHADKRVRGLQAAASERASAAAAAVKELADCKARVNDVLSRVILRGLQFEGLVEHRSTGSDFPIGFVPIELNSSQTAFVAEFLEGVRSSTGPMSASLGEFDKFWGPMEQLAGPWDPDVPAWIDGESPLPRAPPRPMRRLTPTPLVDPWATVKTEPPPAPKKSTGPWKKRREVDIDDPNWAPKSAEEPNVWVMKPPMLVVTSTPLGVSRAAGPHPIMRVPRGGSMTDTDTDSESDADYDWGMEIEIN